MSCQRPAPSISCTGGLHPWPGRHGLSSLPVEDKSVTTWWWWRVGDYSFAEIPHRNITQRSSAVCVSWLRLGGGRRGDLAKYLQICSHATSRGRYWRHPHPLLSHWSLGSGDTERATQVLGCTKRFLKCSLPSSRIILGLVCTSSSSAIISPDREDILRVKYCQNWIECPNIMIRGSLADGLCSVEAPWYFVFSHWNDICRGCRAVLTVIYRH